MQKLFLASFFSIFLVGAAQADWLEKTLKLSCMPELDFFSIDVITLDRTHDVFEKGHPKDMFEKYGVILWDDVKEYKCKVASGWVIKVEIYHYDNPFAAPRYSCKGNNYKHHRIKIWIAHESSPNPAEYKLVFNDDVTWYCNYDGFKELVRLAYHSGRIFVEWQLRAAEQPDDTPNPLIETFDGSDDSDERYRVDYDPIHKVFKNGAIFLEGPEE